MRDFTAWLKKGFKREIYKGISYHNFNSLPWEWFLSIFIDKQPEVEHLR